MKLSPIYQNKIFWVMVYDTGHHPDEPEVELVEEYFFYSPDEAHAWFRKKYKYSDFINPRAIPVQGLHSLEFLDPLLVP